MTISDSQAGLERRRLLALLLELGEATEATLSAAYAERWPKAAMINAARLVGRLDGLFYDGWINTKRHREAVPCSQCGARRMEMIPREEWEWFLTKGEEDRQGWPCRAFELLHLEDTLEEEENE